MEKKRRAVNNKHDAKNKRKEFMGNTDSHADRISKLQNFIEELNRKGEFTAYPYVEYIERFELTTRNSYELMLRTIISQDIIIRGDSAHNLMECVGRKLQAGSYVSIYCDEGGILWNEYVIPRLESIRKQLLENKLDYVSRRTLSFATGDRSAEGFIRLLNQQWLRERPTMHRLGKNPYKFSFETCGLSMSFVITTKQFSLTSESEKALKKAEKLYLLQALYEKIEESKEQIIQEFEMENNDIQLHCKWSGNEGLRFSLEAEIVINRSRLGYRSKKKTIVFKEGISGEEYDTNINKMRVEMKEQKFQIQKRIHEIEETISQSPVYRAPLAKAIVDVLSENPNGLTSYEIIKLLQMGKQEKRKYSDFEEKEIRAVIKELLKIGVIEQQMVMRWNHGLCTFVVGCLEMSCTFKLNDNLNVWYFNHLNKATQLESVQKQLERMELQKRTLIEEKTNISELFEFKSREESIICQ